MFFGMIFMAIVGVAFFAMIIKVYNGLVALNKQVDRSWANIDVILQQRFEEIGSLIKVIEQFTQYEKSVIDSLVEARTRYGRAQSVGDKIEASNGLAVALEGVFAIGENYPELKSSNNFMELQKRISSLEDSIADRREHYNDTVTNFNTRIHQIPDGIFAGFMGYRDKPLYKVEEKFKQAPSLDMNLPN